MDIDRGDRSEDSSDAALPPEHSDPGCSGGDLELAAQAAHPTTLFATADPTFRQALRDRLLALLADHHPPDAGRGPSEPAPGGASLQEQAGSSALHDALPPPPAYRGANAEVIRSDAELRALAAHLDATAPFAMVDPVFRQRLRTQLVYDLSGLCHSSLEASGKLYLTDNGGVFQLVSAEDEAVFLDKAQLVPGEKPKRKLAAPASASRARKRTYSIKLALHALISACQRTSRSLPAL